MKTVEEILRRAVILLCYSDRCSLEDSYSDGFYHSLKERNEQRMLMFDWLIDKGYEPFMTIEERSLFNNKITRNPDNDILIQNLSLEAVGILLWSINLYGLIHKYDERVPSVFYRILDTEQNHSLPLLVLKSTKKDLKVIEKARDISMLYHWRSREGNKKIFSETNCSEIIKETFGFHYQSVFNSIQKSSEPLNDFLVFNKPCYTATYEELLLLKHISYWRQKALEWILNDEDWDNTNTNT